MPAWQVPPADAVSAGAEAGNDGLGAAAADRGKPNPSSSRQTSSQTAAVRRIARVAWFMVHVPVASSNAPARAALAGASSLGSSQWRALTLHVSHYLGPLVL